MKKFLALAIIAVIVYHYGTPQRETQHAPGVMVPESERPIQNDLVNAPAIQHKDYTIIPMADFNITARVLSKENYRFDKEAELSPVDLALGWGPMSDTRVLEKISISQSNRWYHWNVKEFPIPRREIETNSANMHMIPANESVRNTLGDIKKGNIVSLNGKLVRITKSNGWRWQSSMTRNDTGDGACEVVWVEDIYIKN